MMAESNENMAYNKLANEPGAAEVPPPYSGPAQSYAPGQQPGQYPPAAQQPYAQMQPQPYGAMQPQPIMTQPMVNTTSTTVVVAGMNQQQVLQGPRDWNDGLFGCCNDCGSCFMGLCCPCFLLCDVSTQMGEGCCFACCCPGSLLGLRIKLRVQNNIQGSLCDDYCVVQCCPVCVLCQLSRELKYRPRY